MPPLAITTFPPKAWPLYAKICVERLVQCWPGPVRVYFEGSAPPALACGSIEPRPLDEIPERSEFLARGGRPRPGFLWDAKRFCHKVFAQLDTAKDGEPFWWVDADVACLGKIPAELLEQQEMLTFLGRNSYTETGLVGFNPQHPEFADFLKKYRALYVDGTLFDLPYWTDCHAFDAAREGKGLNLTPHGEGFDNVMEQSKFGRYMTHFKGPRKAELYKYGGVHAFSASL